MQTQSPSDSKRNVLRGPAGKAHLAGDMKRQPRPIPLPRVRPIVPSVFRIPD